MADEDKTTPRAPRRSGDDNKVDTTSDKRIAGSAGDDKDAHFITGTGVREEERDGEKVQVMTDRPDNFANDADLGKPENKDDDK